MPLTLLLISECSDICLGFHNCLEREGCQLLLATDAEHAGRTLLSGRAVDAVLIHNSITVRGSVIAAAVKVISPDIPILLITVEWPINGACPPSFDALCRTTTLSHRAARDIARFVRGFVDEKSKGLADGPQHGHARLVAKRPTYVN